MDGMHEAKEEGVLMAQHQCACSCQNRGVFMPKTGESSCQNRGVFIALEMCKMSICPSSHDHVKFSHDCAKLIKIAAKNLTIWIISHDYEKSNLRTTVK